MKQIDFKKDVLPHLLVVLVFIVLVLAYFKPSVLDHKELRQHDILEYRGSAQEIIEYRKEHKEEPLWTNSMFGGMPAYLISTIHKGEIIQSTANALFNMFPHPTGIVLVQLVCFYILLLAFGVRPAYAAIGALAFGFASYTFISIFAGHNNKVKAIGYAPLVIAGVVLVFRNRIFTGFILTAIGVALNMGSNHYQITYYLFLLLVILGIVEFVYALKDKSLIDFFKKALILVLAAGLGLAANFGSFYTTYEYSKYTMRGGTELKPKGNAETDQKGGLDKEYAFRYSYGIFESLSLMIPNIEGGASVTTLDRNSNTYKALSNNQVPEDKAQEFISRAPIYWGDQYSTAGPAYVGAIVCFLFVFGLLILDNKTRIWLLSATLLAIVLAWGKNFAWFNYLVFDYLPGYNKFRSVTFILIVPQICMPIGAILGLSKALEMKFSKELFKKLLIAFGITGGLCFLFGLMAGMFSYKSPVDEQLSAQASWLVDALRLDRKGFFRADAFRSFFFILLTAGVIWAIWKAKLSKTVGIGIISVLVLIDLWTVDRRYLNENNFERRAVEQHFEPTEADQFMLSDQSYFRVMNLINPWSDAQPSYYHKSVGGYSGAKMQRYQDMIEYYLAPEQSKLIEALQAGKPVDFNQLNGLNMLNTKYVYFGAAKNTVIRNDQAIGNAWFVREIKLVNNPQAEIDAIGSLEPRITAVIDKSKFKIGKTSYNTDSTANIKLTEYKPNYLAYESNTANEGFAVFSEVYYPDGWSATIDGKETPIVRVNYILRGLNVPVGKHKIEFRFVPKAYAIGNTTAMVSSIFLLLCIVGVVIYTIKRRKDDILPE